MLEGLKFSILHPSQLDAKVLADWQALCAGNRLYASPLLSPEFAIMVGAKRRDTRTIMAHLSGRLVACLTVQARTMGFARPVGAPFDDYSGPVLAAGFDLSLVDLIRGAGLHSYRANTALIQPGTRIMESQKALCFSIALEDISAAAYMESRRALHPKRFKNFRRLRRKLEMDKGAIRFHWGAPDPDHLATLLEWKSAQFRDDGLLDITKASISKDILASAANMRGDEPNAYCGFMTELRLNGALLAGHFGIRKGAHFHPWISAYDQTMSPYMPGILLLQNAVEAMPEMGLTHYDLAGGHEHYKKYFTDGQPKAYAFEYSRASGYGALQKSGYAAWNLFGARRDNSIAARMRRRLDHIACCEYSVARRLSEFGIAMAKRR